MTNFGPFHLDDNLLLRDHRPVKIGQRSLALLRTLVEAEGAVSKDDLLNAAWPDLVVEEGNLTVQIAKLRKVLGNRPDGSDWIITIPRFGYRFSRSPSIADAPHRLPTLAVLPFENLTGSTGEQYFADGIVDDLIAALSRFRSFGVIGRSTSFGYRHRALTREQLTAELSVRYLLEGSVRRHANRLRIVAKLSEAAGGAMLWAQTFDGVDDDLFDFQNRITRTVAAWIAPNIQRAELMRARRERPGSIAAYDFYLQALAKLYSFQPDANAEAIALLDQAMALEPTNGLYMGFANWALELRSTLAWAPFGPDDRGRCLALAEAAIRQAPDDATVLAHAALSLQVVGHDYERGVLLADRAVGLNPNDVVVLNNAGVAHLVGGSLDAAERFLRRAIEIDPSGAYEAMSALGNVLCCLGREEEALEWCRRSAAVHPTYVPTYWIFVVASCRLGQTDAARSALAKLMALAPAMTIHRFLEGPMPMESWRGNILVDAFRQVGMPEG